MLKECLYFEKNKCKEHKKLICITYPENCEVYKSKVERDIMKNGLERFLIKYPNYKK